MGRPDDRMLGYKAFVVSYGLAAYLPRRTADYPRRICDGQIPAAIPLSNFPELPLTPFPSAKSINAMQAHYT